MSRVNELIEGTLKGNKKSAAKLISLIENRDFSTPKIMEIISKHTGRAYIIGITGPFGVGKSTLINQLIRAYRRRGKRVGVITVDPTSVITGGALLGDRIRMSRHASDEGVFIRSMASRGAYGGLARAVGGTIKILDALGSEIIFLEGVGAGQLDVNIANYAHTLVLILSPLQGDDIQMMKTGLTELADIYVVNKADDPFADLMADCIKRALEYTTLRGLWSPLVIKTVATTGQGVGELVDAIERHRDFMVKNALLKEKERKMISAEIFDILTHELHHEITSAFQRDPRIKEIIEKATSHEMDPYTSAQEILKRLRLLFMNSL